MSLVLSYKVLMPWAGYANGGDLRSTPVRPSRETRPSDWLDFALCPLLVNND
ncbi:hypothetical protein [Nostoc sp.]|uniref:hypothetical protein n=1 Tax=Nostoc sp. TaxID=1180 RepID=UPI002FF89E55